MKLKKKTLVAMAAIALVGVAYAGVALADPGYQDCGTFYIWDPFGWFCNIA